MSKTLPIPASTEGGKQYPSWEALVEGEAHGYVAVAILRERAPRGLLFPMVVGPFPTEREANNARNRIRAKYRRQEARGHVGSDLVVISVKPAWKDVER